MFNGKICFLKETEPPLHASDLKPVGHPAKVKAGQNQHSSSWVAWEWGLVWLRHFFPTDFGHFKNIAIQKRKNNIVPLGISCVQSSKGYSTSISWDSTLNWLIRVTHWRCISGSMKSCMLISVRSQILPCGMAATKKSSLDPWNNGALKTLEGFSWTIHFRTKQSWIHKFFCSNKILRVLFSCRNQISSLLE